MLFPDLNELIKLKQVVQRAASSTSYQRDNKAHGDYTSILHGLGVEFETIRPYVIGDDVRYIDWRTTARIGKPQVKTFRAECDRNVFIVVDANAYMRFGTRGTFKSIQAAKAAAIMTWASLQQQDRVGGLVFGDIPLGMQYFSPNKTHSTALRMLHLLCSHKLNQHAPVLPSTAIENLTRMITPQSVAIIVGDFSSEPLDKLQRSLATLRRRCNVMLLPIFDPSDVTIPDTGTIMFSHDDHQAIIYTSSAKGRQKYQAQWQQYKEGLTLLGKKMQIPIVWIETTMDPVRRIWTN